MGEQGFATRQVHAGRRQHGHAARTPPIHLTAGFEFADFDEAHARFAGDDDGFSYTRVGNPSVSGVESRVAALEGGADALLVASGQAALTVALFGLVRAGDHLVSADSIYEGTRGLLVANLGPLGIGSTFVSDVHDLGQWRRAIRPNTKALIVESISNARNDVPDIAALAALAHAEGIPLIVDSTLATPYLLRPIEHGADIVIHSASKFLSGHGSVLGGFVVDGGGFDWAAQPDRFPQFSEPVVTEGGLSFTDRYGRAAFARFIRGTVAPRLGPTPSPLNAFLIQQGIETLSLRVDRQSASALAVAGWLERQAGVARVDHVGLASHPHHAVGARYLPDGTGSVFQFSLSGGLPAARAFVDAVGLVTHMTHIGDVRSLVLHPGTTSHVHRTAEQAAAVGVLPGTLRLSIGVEDPADLVDDLAQALAAARAAAESDDRELVAGQGVA